MADQFISKIKLTNNSVVYLKDAQARADLLTLLGSHDLEALGAAAWKAVAANVSENSDKLATAAQVKSYVDSKTEAIPTFDVVVVATNEDLPTASASTFHKIYLMSGGISDKYNEWITIRSGSGPNYTYSWERIGTIEADLSGYVKKTTKIADIALDSDITVDQLKTALGLGALAYKSNATGSTTLNTIDSISLGNMSVSGSAPVTYTTTAANLTKGSFTPAGSINGDAISGGSINVTLKDATVASSADLTTADYTPTGKVEVTLKNANVVASVATAGTLPSKVADTFTANVPTTIDVSKFNGGSAASWTGATHTAASLGNATTGVFATEGLTASVGTGDDAETLIFSSATTSSAVTQQGTFTPDSVNFGTFNGGSAASLAAGFYTAGQAASFEEGAFNQGAMPTFTTGTVGVDSASFSGDKASDLQVTGVSYSKQVVDTKTFTPVAANLSFSGTTAENVIVTGVTYDKADAAALFSETIAAPTVTSTTSAKTIAITVS